MGPLLVLTVAMTPTPATSPGATEVCDDGIDNDCDGQGKELVAFFQALPC